jgi:hypothetical protein
MSKKIELIHVDDGQFADPRTPASKKLLKLLAKDLYVWGLDKNNCPAAANAILTHIQLGINSDNVEDINLSIIKDWKDSLDYYSIDDPHSRSKVSKRLKNAIKIAKKI